MNRSHVLIGLLYGLLVTGQVSAAWYCPILRLGQAVKPRIVEYKKFLLGIASVAAAMVSYVGFKKLHRQFHHFRAWKMENEIAREIDLQTAVFRTGILSADKRDFEKDISTTTWGKPWRLKITTKGVTPCRTVRIETIFKDYSRCDFVTV